MDPEGLYLFSRLLADDLPCSVGVEVGWEGPLVLPVDPLVQVHGFPRHWTIIIKGCRFVVGPMVRRTHDVTCIWTGVWEKNKSYLLVTKLQSLLKICLFWQKVGRCQVHIKGGFWCTIKSSFILYCAFLKTILADVAPLPEVTPSGMKLKYCIYSEHDLWGKVCEGRVNTFSLNYDDKRIHNEPGLGKKNVRLIGLLNNQEAKMKESTLEDTTLKASIWTTYFLHVFEISIQYSIDIRTNFEVKFQNVITPLFLIRILLSLLNCRILDVNI